MVVQLKISLCVYICYYFAREYMTYQKHYLSETSVEKYITCGNINCLISNALGMNAGV